jgi:hypothetical protein
VESNLYILTSTVNNLKKQRELNAQNASCIGRIGFILQKIHNLDHTKINLKLQPSLDADGGDDTYFYSDKSPPVVDLEQEEEEGFYTKQIGSFKIAEEHLLPPHSEPAYSKSATGMMKPQLKQNHSETDYDHLDIIKSESQIRHYFSSLGTTADLLNPALPSESFLRERQVTRM